MCNTSYSTESGQLEGGREFLTKKKSASSGLMHILCLIRKHSWPTERETHKQCVIHRTVHEGLQDEKESSERSKLRVSVIYPDLNYSQIEIKHSEWLKLCVQISKQCLTKMRGESDSQLQSQKKKYAYNILILSLYDITLSF